MDGSLQPAFGYVRVSQLDAGREGSLPTQRRRISQLAELRGYEVVAWFEDPDLSAFSGKRRPGYEAMMGRLGEVAGGAVIFYRLDRFCRRVRQFVEAWEVCEQHRVALLSSTEPIDTSSPMGVAMMQVLMVFAELEARTTQARLRDHHATIAVAGRFSGGPAPFGWTYDPVSKEVAIDEPAADVLRAACRAIVSGMSAQAVAQAVNAGELLGVPVPPGRRQWDHSTVIGMLRSKRLVGDREHRGALVATDAFPPIIDRATHSRVLAALGTRARGRPPQPLTGLLVCGGCGGPLYAGGGGGAGRSYPTYQCNERGCGRVAVTRGRIEDHVARELFAWLREPELASRLRVGRQAATPDRRRVRGLVQRLERLERGFVEGLIPEARFRTMRAELLAEQAALEPAGEVVPLPTKGALARLEQAWPELTDDERRRGFQATVERIVVPVQEGRRRRDLSQLVIEWRW